MMLWLFNWFTKITGFPIYLAALRTKVFYQDKKVQGRRIRGKAILISNHTALLDFALWMFVFCGRTLRCIVAEVLFAKNLAMNALLHMWGAIKVDRFSGDFSFIWKAEDILKKGGVVEIFPESRIPTPEERKKGLLDFMPSFVYIALRSGAPVIPVYTDGNYLKGRRACAIIGKPINVEDLYDEALDEKENIAQICEKIKQTVAQLGENLEEQKKLLHV